MLKSVQMDNSLRYKNCSAEERKILRKAGYNNSGSGNIAWSSYLLDQYDLYLEGKEYDKEYLNFEEIISCSGEL